jgi:hypothetical protein
MQLKAIVLVRILQKREIFKILNDKKQITNKSQFEKFQNSNSHKIEF